MTTAHTQETSENTREQPYHPMPLIGDKAPAFVAESTKGVIHFPEDYRGKWVILFSHPADFTPVCTTEFMLFAELADELRNLNTELIGLSIDSLSSHIAWLYIIQEQVKFKGLKKTAIRFPLIADLNTAVSQKYGMIHPGASHTKTVRAVFFIDPQGIIRTILYYPASTGRHLGEIKRILLSLQTSDAFGVATPANWQPGDDVIVSIPGTLAEADAAALRNKEKSCVWFLSLEHLSSAEITAALTKSKPKKTKKDKSEKRR